MSSRVAFFILLIKRGLSVREERKRHQCTDTRSGIERRNTHWCLPRRDSGDLILLNVDVADVTWGSDPAGGSAIEGADVLGFGS